MILCGFKLSLLSCTIMASFSVLPRLPLLPQLGYLLVPPDDLGDALCHASPLPCHSHTIPPVHDLHFTVSLPCLPAKFVSTVVSSQVSFPFMMYCRMIGRRLACHDAHEGFMIYADKIGCGEHGLRWAFFGLGVYHLLLFASLLLFARVELFRL